MSQSVVYSCEVITGQKVRQLKRDDNGYFEHNLGAFNVFNSAGKFYPLLPSVKAMFEKGGALRRRLDNGRCYGELDHPAPEPGQNLAAFIQRLLKIEKTRIACHIKSARLQTAKNENGETIVLVTGMIKGSGPYGDSFEASLLNPDENTALSIRSLTNDKMLNGRMEKHINNIITWDVVTEPGIAVAGKYDTPSMESMDTGIILPKQSFQQARLETTDKVGLESCNEEITRVMTEQGWETVAMVNPENSWYGW